MRYVLDASVGLKWLLQEADSDKAQRLREDFRNAVHELLAPDVFPIEHCHALTRAERQGRLPIGDACLLLADALLTSPTLVPSLTLLSRACLLSSSTRIGVYDCLDVALAVREGCELLTADDRLKRNLPNQAIVLLSMLP